MSNVRQDTEIDALYITCRAHEQVHHTKTVCEEPMLNIDLDEQGNVLGVEILGLQAALETETFLVSPSAFAAFYPDA